MCSNGPKLKSERKSAEGVSSPLRKSDDPYLHWLNYIKVISYTPQNMKNCLTENWNDYSYFFYLFIRFCHLANPHLSVFDTGLLWREHLQFCFFHMLTLVPSFSQFESHQNQSSQLCVLCNIEINWFVKIEKEL